MTRRQRGREDKGGTLLSSMFPEIRNETTMNKSPSWLVMMETSFSLRGGKADDVFSLSNFLTVCRKLGRKCRPRKTTTATAGRKDSDWTKN